MTWPSSARAWSCAIGSPWRAGSAAVVLSALMSPPRPWRKREDDQQGPSEHHPPGRVEAPEVGGAARLGPEVVPAPSLSRGGIDFVFTVRTGYVVGLDHRSFTGSGVRGLGGRKHACSPGWVGRAIRR